MAWDDDDDDRSPPVALPLVADKPASQGAITDAFANPWVSIPYALANAFAAAASPGTARASQALNAGLGMGMASEKNAYENVRRQRLSDAMGKLAKSTTPVKVNRAGVDPKTATYYMPGESKETPEFITPQEADSSQEPRLSEVWGEPLAPSSNALPSYQATEQRSNYTPQQQEIMRTLADSGNGPAVLGMMGQHAFREPRQPRPLASVRPGGALIDPETGGVVYQAPAVSKEPRPVTWRPYSRPLGDRVESGLVSNTGETKDVKTETLGAPPVRPKTSEEIAKIKADTRLSEARIGQAQAATARAQRALAVAKDPKVTTEKLTTELSVALRDQKNARDSGDDEGLENATLVVNELRKSLARRAKERNEGQTMEALPSAKAHKGKIVRDTQTGARMKSDGTKWVPIDGDASY